MNILQSVRVRGERWRVRELRPYERCRLFTLAGHGVIKRVLAPFDDVEAIPRIDRWLPVSSRRWRRACRALLGSDTPPGRLRSASRARIDLMPHQLEPALALLRGAGSRLLLADDVGLGKTIQAGLIVAELLCRGTVERVLILTPAGVREQWVDELSHRFGIRAVHADAAALRQLATALPLGVNPWQTLTVGVASIDYVKRLEVLPAVRDVRWDLVVLDEAHNAAGDSERGDAVRLLADRAAYVVLMTATPHSGDTAAFARLCEFGRLPIEERNGSNRLVIFRRTRQRIRGDESRRVHVLRVRPGLAERHMHDALARYRRAVAAEHGDRALALAVLEKRALSSPWSLAQSVDRRLDALADRADTDDRQLILPLSDPDGEFSSEDVPPLWPTDLALADVREDRRLLTVIAAAAHGAAAHDDSKLRCLRRLLRRVNESVLVFTEYRDTALHLRSALGPRARLLHGGMDRHERTAAIAAFNDDRGSILVATDAAGQGLNLHRSCRFVINVELPWNPMRLEQRIGRVDRIGQSRRVHAVHFVATGTAETSILSRLQDRVARARAAIDSPDPIALGGGAQSFQDPLTHGVEGNEHAAAADEMRRLSVARAIKNEPSSNDGTPDIDRPWVTRVRRRRLRAALAGRPLLIYRISTEDRDGRPVESSIVALSFSGPASSDPAMLVPRDVIAAWRHAVASVHEPFHAIRLERERAIREALSAAPLPLLQPALFDTRAESAHAMRRGAILGAVRETDERLEALARAKPTDEPSVRLLLVAKP